MQWSFLHTPPLPGAANMAVDEALLARARVRPEGVVRVYSWEQPTLSLGRNQSARGAFDPERARAAGIGIVRRPTGGRAVLHHREITYSVTAPAAADRDLRADYTAINQLLETALRALGVDVSIARPARRMPPPGSAPCFELPAPGELMIGSRKLAGSAQLREAGAFLQHGSILVHDDQHRLRDIAVGHVPVRPAATLSEALGREVSAGEFAGHLRDALRTTWGVVAAELDVQVAVDAAAPHAGRYADHAWTWRR